MYKLYVLPLLLWSTIFGSKLLNSLKYINDEGLVHSRKTPHCHA